MDKYYHQSTINSILNIYENFQLSPTGEIIHSLEYKTSEKYRNKNVCIVGFGNTASDIASELTKVSKQVFGFTNYRSAINYN